MREVAGIILLALALAWAAPASAQDWSLRVEGEQMQLIVPPGASPPTVDELTARLVETMGFPRLSPDVARVGDVAFTTRAAQGSTWRLQNDVHRRGSQDVFLPRGTPMRETEYRYEVTASGPTEDTPMYSLRWRIWCAPPPPGDSRGALEICLRVRRGEAEAARIRGYRREGPDYFPVSWPELVRDPTAAAELPVHEFVYRLQYLSRRQVSVQKLVRYGDRTELYDTIRVNSGANGAFAVPAGGATVILTPEGDGVRAALRAEPDIRAFAVSLLESVR